MNQGVVHGSQMVAAGSPNWWSVTNMSTPPRHQHHSVLAAPPQNYFPHQLNDKQEFPAESWSQLLLGSEQVHEEDSKSSTDTKQMQAKIMEKYYEEQLMNQIIISNNYSSFADVKQDQNLENYGAGNSKPFNFWAHQMVSASSPKSCVTDLSSEMLDFNRKSSEWKIINPRDYSDPSSDQCNSTARGGANKKARIQPTSSQTTFKERKETLRDKITAIHQLVSPFGKTDTASVLLEAIGYIRFLQNQIEALSQPYLGSGPRNLRNQLPESEKKEANKDLRSRGLCLVPVSCTFHLGSDNAADYWAPSPFAANIR